MATKPETDLYGAIVSVGSRRITVEAAQDGWVTYAQIALHAHDGLVAALKLAFEEIHHPGAARHEGKDITAIVEEALAVARGEL